jgi:hypothetical protein
MRMLSVKDPGFGLCSTPGRNIGFILGVIFGLSSAMVSQFSTLPPLAQERKAFSSSRGAGQHAQ